MALKESERASTDEEVALPPSTKGVAVRAGVGLISATYGLEVVQRIFDAASPGLRKLIVPGLSSFGIISSSWYPSALIAELLDLAVRLAVTSGREVEHEAGMSDAIAADN